MWADGSGYCHSCGGKKGPGRKESPLLENIKKWELAPYRGLPKATVGKYGIQTGYDSAGDEVCRKYTYPKGSKIRFLPKEFRAIDGFKSQTLFGMDKFNAGSSRAITVVEGEDDAPAAYYMLGGQHPVVALPGATISDELLKECHKYLDSFKQIIVATDSDAAGDRAAKRISMSFPNKTYRVAMSKHKDAQEYLAAGDKAEFKFAWMNAKKYVPENILNTSEQFLDLYRETPDHQYVPTGIHDLDKKILGIMQGMFTVIKAPTGIGKTEFMRFLEHKFIKEGVPIASWHLEETKLRSVLGLVSYEVEDNLTRKDLIEEKKAEDKVKEAIEELTKDELFYQFYLRDGDGAQELIDQIRFFATVCNVKYVFFEPIQDVLGNDEGLLADLSIRLSKLAAELNVGIVTIAHTNDDNEIKYCKMIGQRAAVILSLRRDKDNTDIEVRNTTFITVEKNRPCSDLGYGGCMKFNPKSFMLEEAV
jgi:twinkle protein